MVGVVEAELVDLVRQEHEHVHFLGDYLKKATRLYDEQFNRD